MVPNGWKKEFLGDVAQFSQGIQVDADLQSETKADGLIRFLRISDYVNPNEVPRYISKPSDKYIVNKTDLSMIRYGSAGAGDLVRGLEGAIANNLFRVVPNEKLLSKNFLWFYAHQPVVKNFLFSNSTSSTMPAISFKLVSKLPLLLPPLPEQQKITKILTIWDKAIDTTEHLINNSKQQKKALMQQLLTGKKRLLDNEGKPFEGEWEESRVGDFGEIYSGGTPSTTKSTYWDGDIDWITPTDITKQDKRYINCSQRRITKEGLKNSSAKLVPAGSLLVCTRATIGAMAITSHAMCTNQGFKNIIPNDDYDIEFIYYLLSFNPNQLIRRASGSTFLELSKSEFEAIKFKTPQLKEQQKIAAVLTNADKEIELLEQQLADLQQEKKALMQQLLTGKKRVGVA